MWSLLKKALFLGDAEETHLSSIDLMQKLYAINPKLLSAVSGLDLEAVESKQVDAFGMSFKTPLGLAAGFDKNAEILHCLPYLGFAYAEIGTVTPRPQEGNEKPRLFRIPNEEALFNRMGFNNEGAVAVAINVNNAKADLPDWFKVGINIGKNKETSEEEAHTDYVAALKPFKNLADYVVINVSSPNTPGLRSLQSIESLMKITGAVRSELTTWKNPRLPVLVKLAPELTDFRLQEIIENASSLGVDGWILTNTLKGEHKNLVGGFSGKTLKQISLERLKFVKSFSKVPIISVGGIASYEDVSERLFLGASLVQIYSSWIYKGPRLPRDITLKLGSQINA